MEWPEAFVRRRSGLGAELVDEQVDWWDEQLKSNHVERRMSSAGWLIKKGVILLLF